MKRNFTRSAQSLREGADVLIGLILAREDKKACDMMRRSPELMNARGDWGYPLIAAITRPEPTETNTFIMQQQIAMVSFFAEHKADFILDKEVENGGMSPLDAAKMAYENAPAAPKAEVNREAAARRHVQVLGADPEIKIKRAATAILDLVKQTELSQRREKNQAIIAEHRSVEKKHMAKRG